MEEHFKTAPPPPERPMRDLLQIASVHFQDATRADIPELEKAYNFFTIEQRITLAEAGIKRLESKREDFNAEVRFKLNELDGFINSLRNSSDVKLPPPPQIELFANPEE
jgi:hypothetical protein